MDKHVIIDRIFIFKIVIFNFFNIPGGRQWVSKPKGQPNLFELLAQSHRETGRLGLAQSLS